MDQKENKEEDHIKEEEEKSLTHMTCYKTSGHAQYIVVIAVAAFLLCYDWEFRCIGWAKDRETILMEGSLINCWFNSFNPCWSHGAVCILSQRSYRLKSLIDPWVLRVKNHQQNHFYFMNKTLQNWRIPLDFQSLIFSHGSAINSAELVQLAEISWAEVADGSAVKLCCEPLAKPLFRMSILTQGNLTKKPKVNGWIFAPWFRMCIKQQLLRNVDLKLLSQLAI